MKKLFLLLLLVTFGISAESYRYKYTFKGVDSARASGVRETITKMAAKYCSNVPNAEKRLKHHSRHFFSTSVISATTFLGVPTTEVEVYVGNVQDLKALNKGYKVGAKYQFFYQAEKTDRWQQEDFDLLLKTVVKKIAKRGFVVDYRIFTYSDSAFILEFDSLLSIERELVVRSLVMTASSMSMRLLASSICGQMEAEEERSRYQEAKSEGREKEYLKELEKIGFAWIIDENKQEQLVWLKDGYDWDMSKIEDMEIVEDMSFGLQITFKDKEKFREMTKHYIRERLAIIVNDRIVMSPVIQNEIPGVAVISGISRVESEGLIASMEEISLPFPITFEREHSTDVALKAGDTIELSTENGTDKVTIQDWQE